MISTPIVECCATQTFGISNDPFPKWETPVTVERVREYKPDTNDWEYYIILKMNGNTMKFDPRQWDKITLFVDQSGIFMDLVQ